MYRKFEVEGVRNKERRSRGVESLSSRDGASDMVLKYRYGILRKFEL